MSKSKKSIKTTFLSVDFSQVPLELIAWTQTVSIIEHNTDCTKQELLEIVQSHIDFLRNELSRRFSDEDIKNLSLWETVLNHIQTFVTDEDVTRILAEEYFAYNINVLHN